MKTFLVSTHKSVFEIGVDESVFDRYKDQACEAITIATKYCVENDEPLSYFMIAQEKEKASLEDNQFIMLTEHALRNAAYHELADECADKMGQWNMTPLQTPLSQTH